PSLSALLLSPILSNSTLCIGLTGITVGVPGVAPGSGPAPGLLGSFGGTVPVPGSVPSVFTTATLLISVTVDKSSLTVTTKFTDTISPKSTSIPVKVTFVPSTLPLDSYVVSNRISSSTIRPSRSSLLVFSIYLVYVIVSPPLTEVVEVPSAMVYPFHTVRVFVCSTGISVPVSPVSSGSVGFSLSSGG